VGPRQNGPSLEVAKSSPRESPVLMGEHSHLISSSPTPTHPGIFTVAPSGLRCSRPSPTTISTKEESSSVPVQHSGGTAVSVTKSLHDDLITRIPVRSWPRRIAVIRGFDRPMRGHRVSVERSGSRALVPHRGFWHGTPPHSIILDHHVPSPQRPMTMTGARIMLAQSKTTRVIASQSRRAT